MTYEFNTQYHCQKTDHDDAEIGLVVAQKV